MTSKPKTIPRPAPDDPRNATQQLADNLAEKMKDPLPHPHTVPFKKPGVEPDQPGGYRGNPPADVLPVPTPRGDPAGAPTDGPQAALPHPSERVVPYTPTPFEEGAPEPANPAMMPAYPPIGAGTPENTWWSPAGPGQPLDGSAAVNTYTVRERQQAEFAAGHQDWPVILATNGESVDPLPEPGHPDGGVGEGEDGEDLPETRAEKEKPKAKSGK
jgi:hypothetical protein